MNGVTSVIAEREGGRDSQGGGGGGGGSSLVAGGVLGGVAVARVGHGEGSLGEDRGII